MVSSPSRRETTTLTSSKTLIRVNDFLVMFCGPASSEVKSVSKIKAIIAMK